jgi:hypothetical protein
VLEELVVSAESVIGLTVSSSITTERARIEDEVVARVTRDVKVGDRVAIPEGSTAYGEVTLVERGGKVRERGACRRHTRADRDGYDLPGG